MASVQLNDEDLLEALNHYITQLEKMMELIKRIRETKSSQMVKSVEIEGNKVTLEYPVINRDEIERRIGDNLRMLLFAASALKLDLEQYASMGIRDG